MEQEVAAKIMLVCRGDEGYSDIPIHNLFR